MYVSSLSLTSPPLPPVDPARSPPRDDPAQGAPYAPPGPAGGRHLRLDHLPSHRGIQNTYPKIQNFLGVYRALPKAAELPEAVAAPQVLAAEMAAEETVEWAAVLAENTELDLANLNQAVEKYKYVFVTIVITMFLVKILTIARFRALDDSLFLGRSLKDSSSTIVHHFAESGSLAFPDPEAGIFLSRKLVMELHQELQVLYPVCVHFTVYPVPCKVYPVPCT